jgi:hypothetical protein
MLTEPSTLLTDYALAALSAWLGWRLLLEARQRSVRWWGLGFVATASGSFLGGTYHGFATAMPESVGRALWTATTLAVGLGACLLLTGALMAAVAGTARRWLLAVVWGQFLGYVAWMLRHDDFVYVIAEYGAAMAGVAMLQAAVPTDRRPAARWILAGVVVTLIAAAVQQSGFDLHRHLNHNDLQHLVQMAAVGLFYKGGSQLVDAAA